MNRSFSMKVADQFATPSQRMFFESEALEHLDVLVKSATRILRSVDEAQDVVQETYLRAWKHFGSYQPRGNCRGWLFRILFNVINDRRARPALRFEIPLADEKELERATTNVVSFDPLGKLNADRIRNAMGLLTEEHLSVLTLVVIEELSYRETASLLNLPIGTVMSRLHRARRELKRILGPNTAAEASPAFAIRRAS